MGRGMWRESYPTSVLGLTGFVGLVSPHEESQQLGLGDKIKSSHLPVEKAGNQSNIYL